MCRFRRWWRNGNLYRLSMVTTDAWGGASPETIPWHCEGCEAASDVEILRQWMVTPQTQEDEFDTHQWTSGRCQTCLMPYLLIREIEWGDHGDDLGAFRQIWPESGRTLPSAVPGALRDTYDEAQRCMKVRAFTGSALLARRIVEGICNDLNAKGRTLAAKLADLKNSGVLDERLYEWSALVKDIGNEGAHETATPLSREDAQEVLRFVEALLDYLYVFRARYEEFRQRRERIKAGKPALESFDISSLGSSDGEAN